MRLPIVLTFLTRAIFGLCLCVDLTAQAPQQQEQPPEIAEFMAARRIPEIPARLKELQRIKAAYPQSYISELIDMALLDAASRNADTFDGLLKAQSEILNASKAEYRPMMLSVAATLLIEHEKAAAFPKEDALKAIRDYKSEGMKALASPEFMEALNKKVPEGERGAAIDMIKGRFEIPLSRALLMNGDGKTALKTLEEYGKTGARDASYYSVLGKAYSDQKRDAEALEAFFEAAVGGDAEAIESAKALYAKLNDGDAGFEDVLERRQARLPFHPEAFKAPADWKGKVVLAELFTGSECPPCVGADFAFDGLIDAYSTKYLAVLEYHLPIPRPDPMMNPATEKRQNFYEIRNTPTVVIDGAKLTPGGGGRAAAQPLFDGYRSEIDPRLDSEPVVAISASATLDGEKLTVKCSFSKAIEGAEYNVALVQTEEKYKGVNGIIFHKMVVRDIKTVEPSGAATVTFNIAESEKATDEYITGFENTSTRFKNFKFPVRHNKIDRGKLKAIVFVQDANTKQVYNAYAVDV